MGMFTEIIYEVDLRERKTGNSVETIYSGTDSAEAYEIADKWNKEHGLGEIQEDYESYEELCDYVSDGLFADVYQVELYVEKGKELNAKEVAMNFYKWLIDMEYSSKEDAESDIDEMIEDFEAMEKACPRMFNLLRDISDR